MSPPITLLLVLSYCICDFMNVLFRKTYLYHIDHA